jgi:MFS family permease
MGLLRRLSAPLVGDTDERVIVLALARMVGALGNSFLIVVLPLYIASGQIDLAGILDTELGVGPAAVTLTEPLLIGIVLSLFGFLNSFAQPFTGRLSDRTAKRKLYILLGIALLGTASGLYAFVEDYWAVMVLRALQGIGVGFAVPATVALVNEYSAGGGRGGSFGVFNTFRLIGFGFGPLAAGVVVELGPYGPVPLPGPGVLSLSGFDAAFLVAFLGAFGSFTLVTLLVSDVADTEASAGDDLAVSIRGEGDRWLDPVFTLGVATVFMGITIALFATLQNQVNARLGQDAVFFSLQFGAVVIANVLFQIPVGRLSDEYGRKPFLVGGFLILIPSIFVQGIILSPWLMLIARLLQGVAVAMVFAPSLALAGDLAKKGQSGTTLSVLTMGFGLGIAIGPLASGYLVGIAFSVPFTVGAILALLGLVLVVTQVEETVDLDGSSAPDATAQD